MRNLLLRCVVGSRAYGLDTDASDTDWRGVYLADAEQHWSLDGVPEQVGDELSQECYWEIGKFLRLALKANPTVLECLYTPLVTEAAPLGQELLAMREAFLSRRAADTFGRYAEAQFRKLELRRAQGGELRGKQAMHLIRLLLAGVGLLRTGVLPVDMREHREALLAIRAGHTPWEEILRWRQELLERMPAALADSPLPAEPQRERVNAFLVRARRVAASQGR